MGKVVDAWFARKISERKQWVIAQFDGKEKWNAQELGRIYKAKFHLEMRAFGTNGKTPWMKKDGDYLTLITETDEEEETEEN